MLSIRAGAGRDLSIWLRQSALNAANAFRSTPVSRSRRRASSDSDRDGIELATLGAALWRAKGWIFALALGLGVVTFVALSMMRPLYTSEARILIQNDESAFTRPTTDQGRDP